MSNQNNSRTSEFVFDPKNLPTKPTPVFDVAGKQIGTFNPHTNLIHPTQNSPYGILKLLGNLALNHDGKIVGTFNAYGQFQPRGLLTKA